MDSSKKRGPGWSGRCRPIDSATSCAPSCSACSGRCCTRAETSREPTRLCRKACSSREPCANRALEARLLIRQAAVRVFLGVIGFRQALGICEEAAAVLESAGDFAALADAWVEIGTFHYWLGQTSSDQAALERGAAYARRSGNRAAELLAQESLARSFANLTVPTDLAIERQEQLLEAVKGEPRSEAHVLRHLALTYGFAGRFAEARSAIRRCRAIVSRVRREARLGLYRASTRERSS